MTVVNVTPPVVSGIARQGQVLTTTDGTWTYDDYIEFAYRWLRCDAAGANCVAIGGAVSPSRLLNAADVGSTLRSEVTGTEVAAPPEPPPPPGIPEAPITITTGGTYSGYWKSTSAGTPAVIIATDQVVLIEDSKIENSAGGMLVQCYESGAQLTLRRVTAVGIPNGFGRFLQAWDYQTLTVENCTINLTRGMDIRESLSGATVYIGKNKQYDLQQDPSPDDNFAQFTQFNGVTNATQILVEWNQVINLPGQSRSEDIINGFGSDNLLIRNNYIDGSWPNPIDADHSGCAIIVGDYGGSNNEIHDNVCINQTNCGMAIVGGQNNSMHDNRIISDGRTPAGVAVRRSNIGMFAYNYTPQFAFGNNNIYDNEVGFMSYGNPMFRNDWWDSGYTANDIDADNTHISGTINNALEVAEWAVWLAKLTSNGITVGA